jgi:hypothetical protein
VSVSRFLWMESRWRTWPRYRGSDQADLKGGSQQRISRSGDAEKMAKPKFVVALVEASPNRFVLDIGPGRVVIEPRVVRFHRNGRGRGVTVVGEKAA